VWQFAHDKDVFGACAEAPWQDAQSVCPLFVDASELSCAWQLTHRASLFTGGTKS
jgi:hypothetical protein